MALRRAEATMTADGELTGKMLLGRYELGRLLGRGGSAKVYLATDLRSGDSVAVKCFPLASSSSAAAAAREVEALRRLRHPNVVRLLDVLATRSRVYLVLELAPGGMLLSLLDSRGRLPEPDARRLFHQLLSAVAYCHARGVFHRDLKLENLLLDAAGRLKVADFGYGALARRRAAGLVHTLCGSPAYVAPDVLSKKGYDASKVDVWSCGVILFTLAAGYLPFNHWSLNAMYRKISLGEFKCPAWFSPELVDLVNQILDPDPVTRITVEGIINHKWFRVGLDQDEWTAAMRSHDKEQLGPLIMKADPGRALNAFDLISFSSGCDISGLLDTGPGSRPGQERFFLAETAGLVATRVEEAAKREGLRSTKDTMEKAYSVLVERADGQMVAMVRAQDVVDGLSAVEIIVSETTEPIGTWRERLVPKQK